MPARDQEFFFSEVIWEKNRKKKPVNSCQFLLLMAEIPNNHLGWCWNPINNGQNYQPQLVSRFSLPLGPETQGGPQLHGLSKWGSGEFPSGTVWKGRLEHVKQRIVARRASKRWESVLGAEGSWFLVIWKKITIFWRFEEVKEYIWERDFFLNIYSCAHYNC